MFEFPGAYYEIIRRDFRNLEKETSFLSSLRPPEGSILDIGCGTGTNLRALAGGGRTCVGVDQSGAFIEYAETKATPVCNITKRAPLISRDRRSASNLILRHICHP